MKNKESMKKVLIIAVAVIIILVFAGVATKDERTTDAKLADEKIVVFCETDIEALSDEEVRAMAEVIRDLADYEIETLKHYTMYQAKLEEYTAIETEREIQELEKLIEELPSVDSIKLASMEEIEKASRAYTGIPEEMRNCVANAHKLISAEERMEQIKKECWVTCARCGGDGKVACSLCGGSGSRRVNHTTPNGKTWQVHQECKTTSSCGDCHGKGGEYIEK